MTTQEMIEIVQAERMRRKLKQGGGTFKSAEDATPTPTLYSLLLSWLMLER
jgi:hypothetical protein